MLGSSFFSTNLRTQPKGTSTTSLGGTSSSATTVSNHRQILITCPLLVTTTLNLRQARRGLTQKHNTPFPGKGLPQRPHSTQSTEQCLVPPGLSNTGQENHELLFPSMAPRLQQAEFYCHVEEAGRHWKGPVAGIRQLWGYPGDEDVFPSQWHGMAPGIPAKLQTRLVSRTQPRPSLHSGSNIPGSNCSFLLHDIMLNYTSLSLVCRMGHSDSQMIWWQLTSTPEHSHMQEFTMLT